MSVSKSQRGWCHFRNEHEVLRLHEGGAGETTMKMRFDVATQSCGLGFLLFPSLLSAFHGVCFLLRFSLHAGLASIAEATGILHSFLAQQKAGPCFPFPSIPLKGPEIPSEPASHHRSPRNPALWPGR